MKLPDVVSPTDWQRSNGEQVEKEKQAMRARDAVSAARRRLPMVAFDDDYEFEGPDGKATLLDLFEGRTQLILYSFYFTPGDEEPCSGCSMFTDNLGHPDGLKHLHDRDATFATISLATQDQIEPMRKRLGWRHPWYTDSNREYSTRSNTLEYLPPQRLPARRRRRLPHLHDAGPRSRGPERGRDDRSAPARAPGGMGGLTRRVAAAASLHMGRSARLIRL